MPLLQVPVALKFFSSRWQKTRSTKEKQKYTAGQLSNALPCLLASLSNALTPSRLPCCCGTMPLSVKTCRVDRLPSLP